MRPSIGPKRRLRGFLLILTGISIGLAAAWLLLPKFTTPQQAAEGRSAPGPEVITAPVERGVLREVIQMEGLVEPRVLTSIQAWEPAGATRPVLTYMPAVGSVVKTGEPIVGLSNRPLIFIAEGENLYRDLYRGLSGPDVLSLQQKLIEFGYLRGDEDADGIFGAATEEAVTMLYEAIGYQPAPPPAGVAEASILEAKNAVDQARQALRDAESGGDATSITIAARNLQIAKSQHTALAEMPRLTLPASEVLALPYESILVFGSGNNEGEVVGLDDVLLEIRTSDVFVTATGTRGQVAQIRLDQPALIVAQGHRIESIVESIAPGPDVPDQMVLHLVLADGEFQPGEVVTVEVETNTTGEEVLSVPVSAVRTDADGSSYVTVTEEEGQRRVTVELGLTVGGRIVVIGSVAPGDLVVVGSR